MKVPKIDPTYKNLPPGAREKYVFEIIRTVLFENSTGITVSELISEVPFSKKTVEKNLEKLISLNEGFKKKYGVAVVYFPNHRAIRTPLEKEEKIGDKTFRVTHIENMFGDFIFIQEYEMGNFGKEVRGGLLIPISGLDRFVSLLSDVKAEIKKDDSDEGN